MTSEAEEQKAPVSDPKAPDIRLVLNIKGLPYSLNISKTGSSFCHDFPEDKKNVRLRTFDLKDEDYDKILKLAVAILKAEPRIPLNDELVVWTSIVSAGRGLTDLGLTTNKHTCGYEFGKDQALDQLVSVGMNLLEKNYLEANAATPVK